MLEMSTPDLVGCSTKTAYHSDESGVRHVESTTRSDIWFDDGNIVLQSENVQFRFFQGILATYSPFFRDVFSIPQPAVGADVVEGCPVMRLPEKAADVNYMLSFILEPCVCTTIYLLGGIRVILIYAITESHPN